MEKKEKGNRRPFETERTLKDDIMFQKGVGPQRSRDLNHLGIFTVADLLFHQPRNYIDRISSQSIADLQIGERNLVVLKLKKINRIDRGGGRRQLHAIFTDGRSTLIGVWFNYQFWLLDSLKENGLYKVEGMVTVYRDQLQITHPTLELLGENYDQDEQDLDESGNQSKLLPIYPSSNELTQNFFRKLIYQTYQNYNHLLTETITQDILQRLSLLGLKESIQAIHFPDSKEYAEKGRQRLVFEELFYHQLMLLRVKAKNEAPGKGISFELKKNYTTMLKNSLHFTLTSAQKRVIREIVEDMQSTKVMSRLLQGDVGSGKTIVALFSMLLAVENGYQAVLLVPTEVLAKQHYQSFIKLLSNQPELSVELILGGANKAK
jgi:ATP-dependent DNA helicase RecG